MSKLSLAVLCSLAASLVLLAYGHYRERSLIAAMIYLTKAPVPSTILFVSFFTTMFAFVKLAFRCGFETISSQEGEVL